MSKRTSLLAAATLLAAGCATTPPPVAAGVSHPVIDTAGKAIGTVTVRPGTGGWAIAVDVAGLSPGNHGIHLHEVGRCDAPGFTTAGAHFNPTGHQHGSLNPNGPHQGDLGNFAVGADGAGHQQWTQAWDANSATHGLALVIHASADDNRTDPSGNSGARVACGVIFAG